MIATSGSYLHGNENNANQPGGTNGEGAYVVGSGWISGYAVVNLQSTYHVSKRLEVFARLGNLFDKRYATAGLLDQQLVQSQRLADREPRRLAERKCGLAGRTAGGLGRSSRSS